MMRRVAICLALVFSARCATVVNGPTQRVRVDSIPSGSSVRLEGCGPGTAKVVTAPATVSISRRSTRCAFHFSLPGYQDKAVRLSRTLARDPDGRPSVIGSWCAGCGSADLAVMTWAYMLILVPSLAVDFATGAMYEQGPPQSVVELRPKPPEP